MIWIKCIFGLLILEAITCSPAASHERNIRVQRSNPGEVVIKDANDPKYLELAKEALKKIKNGSIHVVTKVTKATEQVVAGLITEIDFNVKLTSCQSPPCDISNCHSKIFDPPGHNNTEFTTHCGLV